MAAGRGTRFGEMTKNIPKPMLEINGKKLLEHNILKLPSEIDEIIIIVGYLKEKIMDFFGREYNGKKITYVVQEELLGSGHALHLCKNILKNKFLVLMGDDMYSEKDMRDCLKHDFCIGLKKIEENFNGGKIILDKRGNLKEILEGEHEAGNNFLNIGLYVLNYNFFKYDLVKIKGKNEYGLPQTLVKVAQDYPVITKETDFWIQINYQKDLEKARKIMK